MSESVTACSGNGVSLPGQSTSTPCISLMLNGFGWSRWRRVWRLRQALILVFTCLKGQKQQAPFNDRVWQGCYQQINSHCLNIGLTHLLTCKHFTAWTPALLLSGNWSPVSTSLASQWCWIQICPSWFDQQRQPSLLLPAFLLCAQGASFSHGNLASYHNKGVAVKGTGGQTAAVQGHRLHYSHSWCSLWALSDMHCCNKGLPSTIRQQPWQLHLHNQQASTSSDACPCKLPQTTALASQLHQVDDCC